MAAPDETRLAPVEPSTAVSFQGAGLGSGATVEPPAAKRRFIVPAIDGFRGVAALAVVLYHVSYGSGLPKLGGLRSVFISGYMGVDFFFVISGFVLFLPTVLAGGRFGSVRAYGVRRAARIIPAFYVVLFIAVVMQPLLNPSSTPLPWNSSAGAASFLLHLSFLQHSVGLARGYAEGFLVFGVVWTLAIEVSFYVLLPMVSRWYFRHPFVGFAVALVVAQLWKLWAAHASFSVSLLPGTAPSPLLRLILITQIPTYFAHFAAGMTAAWLFVRWRRLDVPWLPRVAVAAQAASVVVIVWLMRAAGLRDMSGTAGVFDHWTNTLPVAMAFAVLVLSTVLAPRWAQLPVINRSSRHLGEVSYGVYLWHILVIGFALTTLHLAPNATTFAFLRMLALTLVVSLVLAWASLAWVERPAIAWARRRSRALEARRSDTGPADGEQVPPSGSKAAPTSPTAVLAGGRSRTASLGRDDSD